jgi:endonuclease/exonuclease/phosphatase (EEP) superfamily protein YafD
VLTTDPRAVIYGPDGVAVRTLPCAAAVEAVKAYAPKADATGALDPSRIRLLTWNIHKEDDAGWQDDLARFAADNDILLLQEVRLVDPLTETLQRAGLRWLMASSFIYRDVDTGVVTASRAPSVAQCTQRVTEPIIRLPKSSVVTWFPIAGSRKTLAVANLHSINFALTLGAYEQQFAEVAHALAEHDGPVILAGDLNTWTDERLAALQNLGRSLGLTEIPFETGRSRFFGRELDHILVRGLSVERAAAIGVESSDHNPVTAVLRVAP